MTTEQKAKAYDEAIERASKLRVQNPFDTVSQMMEHVFPELCESKDEKIRKTLIDFFQDWHKNRSHCWGISVPEILAWLEKQGEHKKFRDSIQVGDEVTRNSDGVIVNLSQLKRVAKKDEKQGEQKSQRMISAEAKEAMYGKTADKVEPKFKVGDWCIDNEDGTIFQIVKVLDNTYTYKTNEDKEYSCSHYSLENDAHLWAIQDAKGGDVLCYKDEISLYKHDIKNCTKQETTFGGFVYHCCYDGKRFITDSLYSLTEQDKMDIHPATKEQRDLLFQKMHEAGYTFDFEKKELKKIEQPELTEFEEAVKDMIDDYRDAIDAHAATTEEVKERAAYMLSLIPHKSAEWSEEDEEIINGITSYLCTHDSCELDGFNKWYDWLKSLKNRVQPQPKQEWRKNEKQMFADIITIVGKSKAYIREYQRELVDFLKFLKERYTWKPSNAQIRALEYIIDNASNTSYSCKIAKGLLEQLKKLKGE